jgi:hypothetical protein
MFMTRRAARSAQPLAKTPRNLHVEHFDNQTDRNPHKNSESLSTLFAKGFLDDHASQD